jgi:hypothetical protein
MSGQPASEGVGGSVGADLAAIEARLAKATPRPWALNPYDAADDLGVIYSPGNDGGMPIGSMFDEADAKLMVAAVHTLPSLLALVGQLQGQLDAVRALCDAADEATLLPDPVDFEPAELPWTVAVRMILDSAAAAVLSDREGTK